MKQFTWLIVVFIIVLAGAILMGCDGGSDRDGVHGEDGVHNSGGVVSDSDIGPQGAVAGQPDGAIVIENSGVLVTRSYDLAGFDEVEASMFDVNIRQGEKYAIIVEVEENVLDYVLVAVEDNRLKLGLVSGQTFNMSNIPMRATITMPDINGLYLEMSGDSKITGFDSNDDLEIHLDVGSTLDGDVAVRHARFDVAMNSNLALSGSCQDVMVHATTGSEVDLEDLQIGSATVIAKGNSHVAVDPDGELNAEADSGSSIDR